MKTLRSRLLLTAVLTGVALGEAGCHYRSITTPQGAKYTSASLGAASDLKQLDAAFDPATGAFRVKLGSAATDSTAVAGAALPVAARASAP